MRVIENLIGTEPEENEWQTMVNDELLKKRIKEWRNRNKRKGASSSSSGGIGGAIASGAKALGGAVLDAGKEAVKEAVVAGARGAVMSLI